MASQDHGIHSCEEVCQEEVITFSRLWEEEEARIIRREEKKGAIEDQDLSSSKEDLSSDEEYEGLNS